MPGVPALPVLGDVGWEHKREVLMDESRKNILRLKNMRLLELKKAIEKAQEAFSYETYNSNGVYYIKNVAGAKSAVLDLYHAKFFNDNELSMLSPIINSMGDVISFSGTSQYNDLVRLLGGIKYSIGFMNDWFQKNMPSDKDENIINIKLPQIQNFSNLEFISKKLEGCFTSVVSEIEGGKIEIKQFDHGSFWIVVAVGAPYALAFVAAIAWSAAVVSKKRSEAEMAKKEVERAGLQNEAIRQLVTFQDKEINELAMMEANALENKYFSSQDNERAQRIREAIKDVSELLVKGVQIQSALSAPESVSNLFPNYKNLSLIESKINKIDK